MVTNYPQQLTATARTRQPTRATTASWRGRLDVSASWSAGFAATTRCCTSKGNRVNMRCTSCGHDTPGWEISGRGPRRRYEGDARRHLLATKRLVLRKSA